jgi:hypothetical protein
MTVGEMRESLEASLGGEGIYEGLIPREPRKDLRKIRVEFLCGAEGQELDNCERFKPGMSGCAFLIVGMESNLCTAGMGRS